MKDNKWLKRTGIVLMSFLMTFGMLFVNFGGGSSYLTYAESNDKNSNIPNIKNKDEESEYKWLGYDSYVKGHDEYDPLKKGDYYDLKVNLNGSEPYQVYCFNQKKTFPSEANSSDRKWYKKLDGTGTTFQKVAANPKLKDEELAEELNEAIKAVVYNGHPNNKNGIMYGIDDLNAILVTQVAVWTYSDSFNSPNWMNRYKISDSQKKLMKIAYERLISEDLYTNDSTKAPDNYKLNIFIAEDKTYQNLLSVEEVPDNPTKTKVYITKVDSNGVKLEGAKLQVTGDKLKDPIEWTTAENTHELKLYPGNYALEEITAPDGFKKVSFDFKVNSDGSVEVIGKINGGKAEYNEEIDALVVTDFKDEPETPETETPETETPETETPETETPEAETPETETPETETPETETPETETPEPEKEIDIPKPTPEPYRSTIEIPKYKPVKPVVPVEEEEKPMIVPSVEEKKYVPNTADC